MPSIARLWNAKGRLTQARYLTAGVFLFLGKFAIDHLIARIGFARDWSLLEYLAPGQALASLITDHANRAFYLTMCAAAVPFIIAGLSLTLQRLRDAGLPMGLVALFFLPLGNIIFFLCISLVPSKDAKPTPQPKAPDRAPPATPIANPAPQPPPIPLAYGQPDSTPLVNWPLVAKFPRDSASSALLAILLPVPFMVGAVYFGASVLKSYGWGMFVGLPFINGMLCALIHGMRVPRTANSALKVASFGLLATGAGVIVFALEGLGCMIMFLPLAFPIGLLGALLGHAIQNRPGPREDYQTWRYSCSSLGVLLALMSLERAVQAPATMFSVTTSIEIDAPPGVVWNNVVTFSEIGEVDHWLFKTGVAYPVRARIEGKGVGAIRYCEFSTGAFVEPIEIWDEPRLLKFSVTQNPPPMKEWTPWPGVHSPHLEGFLVSSAGEFRLEALPGGRTRLVGTTWYRHTMWPAQYWRAWSDYIIGRIHTRVLGHIEQLSENRG